MSAPTVPASSRRPPSDSRKPEDVRLRTASSSVRVSRLETPVNQKLTDTLHHRAPVASATKSHASSGGCSGGGASVRTINLSTPVGVQQLRHQLDILAADHLLATGGSGVAKDDLKYRGGGQQEHQPESFRVFVDAVRGATMSSTTRRARQRDVDAFRSFMSYSPPPMPVSYHNPVPLTMTSSSPNQGNSPLRQRNSARRSAKGVTRSLKEEDPHLPNEDSKDDEGVVAGLTNVDTIREQLQQRLLPAMTTDRGSTESLAAAMDDLLEHIMKRGKSSSHATTSHNTALVSSRALVPQPPPATKQLTSTPAPPANHSSIPNSNTYGGGVGGEPPWLDDHLCFSEATDSLSVVQNHMLGQPKRIDMNAFLRHQRAISNVLFAGLEEVAHLVRSQCVEHSAMLESLSHGLEALLLNAHDAARYFQQMTDDIAALRLPETVKELSQQLRQVTNEKLQLEAKNAELEKTQLVMDELRATNDQLVTRQTAVDAFLKEQLQRNATILKMATIATGGIIPAHVVAAMTGQASMMGGSGGSMLRRRSTRSSRSFAAPSSMRRAQTANGAVGGGGGAGGGATNDGNPFDDPSRVDTQGSNEESALPTPNKTSGTFDAPPFFLVAQGGGMHPSIVIGDEDASGDDLTMDDGDYDMVDAAVQVGVEDQVNAQVIGEMTAYFTEMDKAANFTQTLCRVVYGTTDFYNPIECCDNARKVLDGITARAQEGKDAVQNASNNNSQQSGGSTAGGGGVSGGGGGRMNLAALIGYLDVPKERIVKLLQYGANAAREMRLRFGSMAESESFRRAIEWRPPRGARDPCRVCNRLGPLPEEQAALAEVADLRAQVTSLLAERSTMTGEMEKLFKRIEYERQIAQGHNDDLQAMYKIKHSMQHFGLQTDPEVRFSASTQTEGGYATIIAPYSSHTTAGRNGSTTNTSTTMAGGGGGAVDTQATPASSEAIWSPNRINATGAGGSQIDSASAFQAFGGGGDGGGGVGGGGGSDNSTPIIMGMGGGVSSRDELVSSGGDGGPFLPQPNAFGQSASGRFGDNTFVTNSVNVNTSRRRSSIDFTFDKDALTATDVVLGESPGASGSGRVMSAGRGGGLQQQQQPSPYTDVYAAAAAGLSHQQTTPTQPMMLQRRLSETTQVAQKFRNAFLSLSRVTSATSARTTSANNSSGTATSMRSTSGSMLAIPSFYRDRTSPIEVDAAVLANGPVKSLQWAVKMLAAVYRNRYSGGLSGSVTPNGSSTAGNAATRPPTPEHMLSYNCSRHFTDYLKQTFGAKNIVDDNAANFLRCVHHYAPSDARFALFSKLFSDEYHRDVYRIFLTFNTFLDQSQGLFDSSKQRIGGNSTGSSTNTSSACGGDDHVELAVITLEAILHCIHAVFWRNDRIQNREEFSNLLAEHAIDMSTRINSDALPAIPGAANNNNNVGGQATSARRRVSVAVRAFDAPAPTASISPSTASLIRSPSTAGMALARTASNASSALGTPIEASDSFSKYRSCFTCIIPADAARRVVQRAAFLAYMCDIARPYVVRSLSNSPSSSYSPSRPPSAPQQQQQQQSNPYAH